MGELFKGTDALSCFINFLTRNSKSETEYLKLKRSYVEYLKALYLDPCYFCYILMTSINLPRNLLFIFSQTIQV